MAIRDDFAPGEVLAAADLNDTFASKVPFSYGTATPSTTVEGFIWFDENDTPPSAKVWDGSDFVTFSGAGNADFSDAATGTYTDGGVDYKYITYTGSGTLTCTVAGLCDVLVIGSGGGGSYGGGRGAGGGGAGGYLYLTNYYLSPATLTVTIPAGGVGGTFGTQSGVAGVATVLGSLAVPGGGAGADNGGLAQPGGSGGGRARGDARLGIGMPPLGNNGGGSVETAPGYGAGGGGGASAAGSAGTSSAGGAGGAGLSNSITGTSVARGGGGGGSTDSGSGGSATAGGGAGGGNGVAGTNGTANTGGGGGGGNDANGGNGGSGVVIIRVKV